VIKDNQEINAMKKRYFVLLISLLLGTVLFAGGCSGGAVAKAGDTVKVDYTLKLANGTVYQTSVGSTPFEFTLGQNQVISGFEKAVNGMKVGETKTVTIPAAEAYGTTPSASNPLAGQDLTFIIKLLQIEK
jgi:FKBP-type peptidyl-prolyl cis-trans isomerase